MPQITPSALKIEVGETFNFVLDGDRFNLVVFAPYRPSCRGAQQCAQCISAMEA
ncbi:hypothetical protein [Pseudanabaena sp. FACHB-2040]|uniref:hypothetical protein n=1 Tax=Pseudanabaena sp. FACHB-2040 TaxID=2692859 RepID=UPI001685FC29|nr:hypothetical protein [Pseudanabaena sp. FACHB-2040]MBD2259571.1 hypothetical protein [Pseudanabaena sp. FACHB-2040]